MEEIEVVNMCSMDFERAFDPVNLRLPLVKLRALGSGDDCNEWVQSVLENWEFKISLKELLTILTQQAVFFRTNHV